jgi:hypothetical protein
MKISQTNVGNSARLDAARPAQTSERASKAFSLKAKGDTSPAARSEVKTPAAESTVATSLRSVASDFKAGKIPTKEEAVRTMVSTILREKFGSKVSGDRGFQRMEQSISSLISDDPVLSKRMESLLQRMV